MSDNDTLGGWGDENKVAYFLANADIIVPRRAEQIKLLLELLPCPLDTSVSVLDLGAGYGAVTERILERYPRSTVTCIDGSEAMIVHAGKRLHAYGNRVQVLKADLAERSWSRVLQPLMSPSAQADKGGGAIFDAVVSAIAIHHLSHQRKQELYCEIFQLLIPNGIFLNNDVVATPPALKDRFEVLNLDAILEQEQAQRGIARTREQLEAEMREQLRLAGKRHHSRIAPLSDQLRWLADAGFRSVDCYWRYLDLAIFGGVKESEGDDRYRGSGGY
jgi:tRNA (cmo5U34)-methyltransferase